MLFSYTTILALVASISAQGTFNGRENSAAVLRALQKADATTITSGQAAAAFNGSNSDTRNTLVEQNQILLKDWQRVIHVANAAEGFYTEVGAQAIIDFVNNKLYPDTKAADIIYAGRRADFVSSGFIKFINPGLLRLRRAVDAAGAAISARTRARQLTPIAQALLLIEQDYASVQELQQNGST